MDPAFQNALIAAGGVCVGTFPLIGVIGWAAFQQNNRFKGLEQRFTESNTSLEKRLTESNTSLEKRLTESNAALEKRMSDGFAAFGLRLNDVNGRLERIEKQLDNLGNDLKALGVRVNDHDVRIKVLETEADRPPLVAPR